MNSAHAKQARGGLSEPALEPEFGTEDLLFDLDSAILDDRGLQRHTVLVGHIGLILPADEVSELIEKVAVCGLPNTRAWFHGVTGVRGNMVPVFDLHALFSIEQTAVNRRLIVVGQNESAAAFWVDDFPRLLEFSDEDAVSAEPQIPPMLGEHVRRFYQKDGQVWVEWDFKSFFTALGDQL